ncbi:hypothetical protein [Nocardioides zeae]
MTGVCSSGDAGGFGPPVPEEPAHLVVDLPVPDWLEHAFATGEWPEEADNAWSTLSLPEGRYDAAEPVADVEPGAWVAPGVPATARATRSTRWWRRSPRHRRAWSSTASTGWALRTPAPGWSQRDG